MDVHNINNNHNTDINVKAFRIRRNDTDLKLNH